jgi:WD40 repeat protein
MSLRIVGLFLFLQGITSWCLYNSFVEIMGQQINDISWSPDGQYIIIGSNSTNATIYDFNTLSPIWSQSYTGIVMTAKYSKAGNYFAVGTLANDTVFIYNASTYQLHTSYAAFGGGTGKQVYEIDFNTSDTGIVACGSGGYISVYLVNTDKTTTYKWNVTK